MSLIEDLEIKMKKKEIEAMTKPRSAGKKPKKHIFNKPKPHKKITKKEYVKHNVHKLKNDEIKKIKEKIKIMQKNSGDKKNIQKKQTLNVKTSPEKISTSEAKFSGFKKDDKKLGILEKYNVELDGTNVRVEIEKNKSETFYNLHVPEIGVATASLLGDIRNELVSVTSISMKEILDPNAFSEIKKRFMEEADKLLKTRIPTISEETKKFFVGKLIQDMLGLGVIEFLINDINLEEVVIPTSKEPIRVYHKRYGWLPTNLTVAKEDEIANYSNIVARRVGRQITVLTPLLDAHLVTGDRVNSILYPISTKGNTITIRKFARDPFTIVDLINNKTCDLETAALLWLAVEYEMNVLISGGTASGKTSLLNACMPFIPPNHRIISVEDTRELMLPDFLYWTPLVTRMPNPEGKGEVSMLDLLVNSLRMRPDRIVLGEMRRQREAEVLFEAMHTGHSVYATLHADSAAETVSRLTNPPLNVPPNLLRAVNLNIVMFRDRRKGIRRITQIAEFETKGDEVKANILYRWIADEDRTVKHAESSRFFEDINRNTGMSQTELNKNLDNKKKIILWMVKNNIRDLNDFGKVMKFYYTDKESLMESIKKNDIKGILNR
ncbi:CpaF family protein [Candidatus Pacearchaeota archaeon]|nr:CpaF family protein [Candidatus Pacearchaeota archaeon]